MFKKASLDDFLMLILKYEKQFESSKLQLSFVVIFNHNPDKIHPNSFLFNIELLRELINSSENRSF